MTNPTHTLCEGPDHALCDERLTPCVKTATRLCVTESPIVSMARCRPGIPDESGASYRPLTLVTLACHALLKLPFAAKMQAVQTMTETHPALVDDVLGANKLGHWPLQDFLQSITLDLPDDAAAEGNSRGDAEAVTISTVHAAKGAPPLCVPLQHSGSCYKLLKHWSLLLNIWWTALLAPPRRARGVALRLCGHSVCVRAARVLEHQKRPCVGSRAAALGWQSGPGLVRLVYPSVCSGRAWRRALTGDCNLCDLCVTHMLHGTQAGASALP